MSTRISFWEIALITMVGVLVYQAGSLILLIHRVSRDVASAYSVPNPRDYVKRFEADFKIDHIEVPVAYATLTRPHVGECWTYSNAVKTVYLDQKYFYEVNDCMKEQLVYHELGHCVLGADHDERTVQFSDVQGPSPASIMRHTVFSEQECKVYFTHKDYYITQLKGLAK